MKFSKFLKPLVLLFAVLMFLVSCSEKTPETVMKIRDFDVSYDVYRYVVMNSKKDIESEYGKDVWHSDKAAEAEEKLNESVKKTLATIYTVCILGREYGVEWDSKLVASQMEVSLNQMIDECGGDDEFEKLLENAHLTLYSCKFVLSNEILIDEVFTKIIYSDKNNTDDGYLKKLFESDKVVRVKHILVGGENAGTDEQNLAIAKNIYAKIENGADFDVLCREYNNDLYMFNNDAGYYITRGTRDKVFEDTAFSLEIGECSEIVKTELGYSIIKRYEKDAKYMSENFNALKDEYFESIYTAVYEAKYTEVFSSVGEFPEEYKPVKIK